jgi:hypothetical protein
MKVWIDQISAGDILVPGEHAAPFNLLDRTYGSSAPRFTT